MFIACVCGDVFLQICA